MESNFYLKFILIGIHKFNERNRPDEVIRSIVLLHKCIKPECESPYTIHFFDYRKRSKYLKFVPYKSIPVEENEAKELCNNKIILPTLVEKLKTVIGANEFKYGGPINTESIKNINEFIIKEAGRETRAKYFWMEPGGRLRRVFSQSHFTGGIDILKNLYNVPDYDPRLDQPYVTLFGLGWLKVGLIDREEDGIHVEVEHGPTQNVTLTQLRAIRDLAIESHAIEVNDKTSLKRIDIDENIINETKTIPVVIGIIDTEKGVLSKLGITAHSLLGYHFGSKWRYNPETKIVYWSTLNHSDQTNEDMMSVENHLRKKYGYKVINHIDMNQSGGHKYIKISHGETDENTQLNEWHKNYPLTVMFDGNTNRGGSFWFFRGGQPAGFIRKVSHYYQDPEDTAYVVGFGVKSSLQGSGIGRAMLGFVFEKLPFTKLSLLSGAHAFYHKVGGSRKGIKFIIDKERFKPSKWKFKEMRFNRNIDQDQFIIDTPLLPSLNESVEVLNERLTFADLYDDTDDERIFKSKLAGMRVRPRAITTENGNETWNFGYTSQEKSQYQRHGGKVGHEGRIIFFKDSIEPEDNAEDLECMVDCDCKDFQFRFAYVNAQDDASMVGPDSLNKATNTPPVKTNPEGHQQLCKHLSTLVRYLVTNIDKARERSHLRQRSFFIHEAMNELADKWNKRAHSYGIPPKIVNETRIITPDESLYEGYITLYHGTTWPIALKAKKGELGPQELKSLTIDILMNVFHETSDQSLEIYNKYSSRSKDPNLLFLTTSKEGAEAYARSATKYGGEIFHDIIGNYLWNKGKNTNQYLSSLETHLKTNEPAVVTVNVPLSMVLTHSNWNTPLRSRIRKYLYNIRSQYRPEDLDDHLKDLNFEVFVKEKIPRRFIQRIDRVEGK